jgi:hypothetical protein
LESSKKTNPIKLIFSLMEIFELASGEAIRLAGASKRKYYILRKETSDKLSKQEDILLSLLSQPAKRDKSC